MCTINVITPSMFNSLIADHAKENPQLEVP